MKQTVIIIHDYQTIIIDETAILFLWETFPNFFL